MSELLSANYGAEGVHWVPARMGVVLDLEGFHGDDVEMGRRFEMVEVGVGL